MLENEEYSIVSDLNLVHSVVNRALDVVSTNISASTTEGFKLYVITLLDLLDSHHTVEDKVVFPYFSNLLSSSSGIKKLYLQHEEMHPYLAEIKSLLEDIQTSKSISNTTQRLFAESIDKLKTFWYDHIKLEDEIFTQQMIKSFIDKEEEKKICMLMVDEAVKHTTSPFLLVPFVLFNLEEKERKKMAKVFPIQVVEELVPGEWKDKWEPMQQYLLL